MSYKMALARALIECKSKERVPLARLAEVVARTYYRHAIYHRLIESPPLLPSVAVEVVRWSWTNHGQIQKPPPYNPPNGVVAAAATEMTSPQIHPPSHNFFRYVLGAWGGNWNAPQEGDNSYFRFSRRDSWLEYKPAFLELINDCKKVLQDLNTRHWTGFLERYNDAPRLTQKVSGKKPNSRLTTFHALFTEYIAILGSDRCWLCEQSLAADKLTLDHVVPFSFQFADELWNLVPAHRACNSRKGSRIGSPELLKKVTNRNRKLWSCDSDDLAKWTREVMESEERFVSALNEAAAKALGAGYQSWTP